jgi:hypothetical protein
MKATSAGTFLYVAVIIFFISHIGCMVPATMLQHAGNFSNIRSEIHLNDGTRMLGYASFNADGYGGGILHRSLNGKQTALVPLEKVNKVYTDEHEFVVRRIETPAAARKEGKPAIQKVVLKRLNNEQSPIQVFEYKYTVDNPKSSMPITLTTSYAFFAHMDNTTPLPEVGKDTFRKQWQAYLASEGNTTEARAMPANGKALLQYIKKYSVQQPDNAISNVK